MEMEQRNADDIPLTRKQKNCNKVETAMDLLYNKTIRKTS